MDEVGVGEVQRADTWLRWSEEEEEEAELVDGGVAGCAMPQIAKNMNSKVRVDMWVRGNECAGCASK